MLKIKEFDRNLEKLTSYLKFEPDWQLIYVLGNSIRLKEISTKYAIEAIKTKILSQNSQTALNSLIVLENVVRFYCDTEIYQELFTKSNLTEFVEIIRTTPHIDVKNKLLQLIQFWCEKYQPVSNIINDNKMLKKKLEDEGFKFPVIKGASQSSFSNEPVRSCSYAIKIINPNTDKELFSEDECDLSSSIPKQNVKTHTNEESQLTNNLERIKTSQIKSQQQKARANEDNFSKIFTDPDFKDFTINVGKSSFEIHKILFAAKSQTLYEIFKNNSDAQELNLNDIPEATFKAIYDFIYGEDLTEDANFYEIFAAAKKLKIEDLIQAAAEKMIENLDEKNAYNVLVLSNKFNHEELRRKVFKVIQEKIFPDLKLSDDLAKNHLDLKDLIDVKMLLEQKIAELKKKNLIMNNN